MATAVKNIVGITAIARSLTGPNISILIISEKPMTALSGVRSS
jgi:hypothetical protein